MTRKGSYSPTHWEDKVIDGVTGDVMFEGTPVDETNLNNMEEGVQLSHFDIGLLALFLNQQQIQNTKELEKIRKQRILQGEATITNTNGTGGYFRSSDPFVQVALGGFPQTNAPHYAVLIQPLSGDLGLAGNLEVYDRAQNGFKVKMTGTAKSVTFSWTLINTAV